MRETTGQQLRAAGRVLAARQQQQQQQLRRRRRAMMLDAAPSMTSSCSTSSSSSSSSRARSSLRRLRTVRSVADLAPPPSEHLCARTLRRRLPRSRADVTPQHRHGSDNALVGVLVHLSRVEGARRQEGSRGGERLSAQQPRSRSVAGRATARATKRTGKRGAPRGGAEQCRTSVACLGAARLVLV